MKRTTAIVARRSPQLEQGMDLIDLRQIFREMAGADFFASEATATLLVASEATMAFVMEELFRF